MADPVTVSATVVERVDAPVEDVWRLLGDFHALARRMTGLTRFEVEGTDAGAIRTFQVGDGPVMRERLEAFDPKAHSFTYSLLPPAFLEDYIGTVDITPDGTGACVVQWSGSCTVASAAEADERRAFFETVYRNGIAWARRELGLTADWGS